MNLEPTSSQEKGEETFDRWPIINSGLSPRVVHCLTEAGVETVGEMNTWSDERLMRLRHFGVTSLKNIYWFRRWTKRASSAEFQFPHYRALLQEFLNKSEMFVLEQRYGMTDPLFRPQMRRRTLQEIADLLGGMTRERVRQIEEQSLIQVRSALCRQLTRPFVAHLAARMRDQGGVVLSAELTAWTTDPLLDNYQPWGLLLLLTEIADDIRFRYDYFTCLPAHLITRIEESFCAFPRQAGGLVSFQQIKDTVASALADVNLPWDRVLTVMLTQHPEISLTSDGRYFIRDVGAPIILHDILRAESQPLHFYDLTRIYNERVHANSRVAAGQILRQLAQMTNVRRLYRGVYELSA